MKKTIIISFIILSIFLIYLCNMDKKVYYLVLGDSLAKGEGPHGKIVKGYSTNIKNYLKEKNILETYIDKFTENGKRTTDLINDIKLNKKIIINKKQITIQNALIKADLVTLSIGANDILSKINIEQAINYNIIYDYIDQLNKDLDKLLKIIREYCKEDIILIGYYNPYPYLNNKKTNDIFDYLNKKYKITAQKYNIKYLEIDDLFKENPNFLPNENDIHPSEEAYKAISNQIITVINKTLLKTWHF